MNKVVILFGLLLLANSLYTSSYFAKKGFNVKDKIIDNSDIPSLSIETQCNDVNLTG